jgi:hypothetical protein
MSDNPNSVSQYFPRPHKARSGGPSTALALTEMRKAILERVDVLQNFIDVANGKMPEKWDAALNPRGQGETSKEPPTRLTIEHMLHASLVLLRRILPEYRQVEVSSGETSELPSFEEARAIMETAIRSITVAKGGYIDEHGIPHLPSRTVVTSGEAAPADDTEDAELSVDEESEKAEPMPEAAPEEDELCSRPERPTRH